MRKIVFASMFCFAALSFSACEKEEGNIIDGNTDVSQKARIQYYSAIVGASRNYVYIDGKPANGSQVSYAAPLFPASSYGFTVDPGMHLVLIRDTLTATTQPIVTYTQTFDAGKHYTIFSYDTVNKAKYMIVPTNIVVPTDTTARVRFAHLAHLHTPVPNVDVYSVKRKANVWSNVSFATVTEFVPYASASTDSLIVRPAGDINTNLDTLFSFNPTRQRSYTVVFRGRYLTSRQQNTTNPRNLAVFANY